MASLYSSSESSDSDEEIKRYNASAFSASMAKEIPEGSARLCFYCREIVLHDDMEHPNVCLMRPSQCRFTMLGCFWTGPHNQLSEHEEDCEVQFRNGAQMYEHLNRQWIQEDEELEKLDDFMKLTVHNYDMVQRLQFAYDLKPDTYYFATSFKANENKFIVEILWQNDNNAHNGRSTLSYRLKLVSPLQKDHLKIKYVALKNTTDEFNCILHVNNMEFTKTQTVTPDCVFVVDSAQYCEHMLRLHGIYLRFYLSFIK